MIIKYVAIDVYPIISMFDKMLLRWFSHYYFNKTKNEYFNFSRRNLLSKYFIKLKQGKLFYSGNS